ncbi:MAG: DNA mismatch repair endonuclease MutL [Verrucomicrobia bacterium]|nr:DNA mismatch repair endonuclease MutL [Verrucomicrobiota bacterium]
MNRIRLLPDHVANQIAAGEVVDRPASVVKELVENALDAGASRIGVDLQAGGRSLIRVTDDGWGMTRDDALLSFERHATSKIRRAEDLSAVATLGFRGEALPSIASVSRLTLTTRERDAGAEATQILIHGGKIVDVKAAGSPPGTCVEVRQLFFNLPARRKFLRSQETEYAHIHHCLTLAALAHPGVAFNLNRDGRSVWQLPAVSHEPTRAARLHALRERLRVLLGSELALLAVDHIAPAAPPDAPDAEPPEATPEPPASALRLWGYIGAPGVSRATREDQYLFVNRRPVENRTMNYALLEGYHTALMKGRYPVGCLFLELDPALVDVNVHPAKREVKFHNDKAVRQLICDGVRHALLRFHAARAPADSPSSASSTAVPAAASPMLPTAVPVDLPTLTPLTGTPLAAPPTHARPPSPPVGPERMPTGAAPSGTALPQGAPAGVAPPAASPPAAHAPGAAPEDGLLEPTPLLRVPLRVVGVVGKLYVVLESDRGLVLMDQHAAHERVLFEQMLARLEAGQAPSQRLLLPETVELSVRDAQFLRELLPALARLGVGLSDFGERTFLLDALPPFVKVSAPRQYVLGLIDGLKAAGQELHSHRLGEDTIAKTVCRHAIKANDPLAGPEIEQLLADLRQCAMPYTCPHGRPTLVEMSYRELEKKFGRVTG